MSEAYPCGKITAKVNAESRAFTVPDIAARYLLGNDRGMKSSEQVRAENLEILVREKAGGKASVLATLVKKNETLISRWRSVNKNWKKMSPDTAREFERALNLPMNWMDQDHSRLDREQILHSMENQPDLAEELMEGMEGIVYAAESVSIYHPEEAMTPGEFGVPSVNLRVGAGSSIVSENLEVEGLKRYSLEWAIKYALKPERLIRYQVRGNSMEPIIKEGAWILVEMGECQICDGNPYLIRSGEDVQVKFLFRRPDGGIIIRSHNPAYPDVILTGEEANSIQVLGRIVESVQMWIRPVNGNGWHA